MNNGKTARTFTMCVAVALAMLVATVAQAATGFGTYAYRSHIGGVQNWRAHVKLMKKYGMNTFVIEYGQPEELRDQIDIAIEEGMLDPQFPVIAMANIGDVGFAKLVPDWEKVKAAELNPLGGHGQGHFAGRAYVAKLAQGMSKYPDQWPEIVAYNIDEPGRGKPMTSADKRVIGEITSRNNEQGVRCGTAVCYPNVKNMVPLLDIVCVSIIIGGDLHGCKQLIEASKKEFWVYDTQLSHAPCTPEMVRWSIGLWTWLVQPRVRLSWCWKDYLLKGCDMANPEPSPQLVAYGEGVKDYNYLTATQAQLDKYRAEFDWEGYPVKEWIAQGGTEKTVPPIDFEKLLPKRVQ